MTAAAVLFDMDGLLLDSEPAWYDAEAALAAELGVTWSPAHQAACLGGTMAATADYLIGLSGTDRSRADLAAALVASMAQRFRERLPVFPGALELVDGVRAEGVRTGLVSSSYRQLVDAALAGLGPDRFDASVAGDEVTHGKPDPEPYLTACRLLRVDPARTVVLEDAIAGVRSAEAAGCSVVAVPSLTPIEPAPGRRVRPTLADVDVAWLLSLVR